MALDFDGVDDYVDHGSGASLDITGDMTTAAWVWVDTADSTSRRIFSKRTTGDTHEIDVNVNNFDGANSVEVVRGRATTPQYSGAGGAFTTGAWALIINTFVTTDFPRTYVGTLAAAVAEVGAYGYSDTGSGAVGSTSATALWVGRRPGIASFDGRIARVGVWAHAFNATERTNLRTQTAAEWALISDARLVAAYGGSGSQTDLTGNGNHGTISGAVDIADPVFPSASTVKALAALGVG